MTNFLIKHFIPNASDVKSPAVRQRYGVVSGVVGILCNALLCTAIKMRRPVKKINI